MSNYDMDEIERQRERERRSRGIRTVKEDRYDDHIVGQPLLEPSVLPILDLALRKCDRRI